jgi:hypothetical protein
MNIQNNQNRNLLLEEIEKKPADGDVPGEAAAMPEKKSEPIYFILGLFLLIGVFSVYYFVYVQKNEKVLEFLRLGDKNAVLYFEEFEDENEGGLAANGGEKAEDTNGDFMAMGADAANYYYAQSAEVRLRDSKRISEAKQLFTAISLHLAEKNKLPSSLAEFYSESEFKTQIFSDPKPNMECGADFEYEYKVIDGTDDFEIVFCLENGTAGYEIGKNPLSSNNVSVCNTVADTDGDGLNDYIESTIFKTNIALKDSDGDGYDDFQEVISSYDPLGPGKIDLRADPGRFLFSLIYAQADVLDSTYLEGDIFKDLLVELGVLRSEFEDFILSESDFDDIKELKEIKYENYLDESNVHIGANVIYKNGSCGSINMYLIKNGDAWYINIIPELLMMKNDPGFKSHIKSFSIM